MKIVEYVKQKYTGRLYSAFTVCDSSQSAAGNLTRDHDTVLPATMHTCMHTWPAILLPSRRASPHFVRYSFPLPAEGRRLSCPGWLVAYRGVLPVRRRPPIPYSVLTARAHRRVTPLMLPTPLPLYARLRNREK